MIKPSLDELIESECFQFNPESYHLTIHSKSIFMLRDRDLINEFLLSDGIKRFRKFIVKKRLMGDNRLILRDHIYAIKPHVVTGNISIIKDEVLMEYMDSDGYLKWLKMQNLSTEQIKEIISM